MLVDEGHVVTAGAALAHVDLMLYHVRRFAGPAVAELCARYLVVDSRPSQARYVVADQLWHDSVEVRRAEAYARKALGDGAVTLEELARAAKVSPRTLERRFSESLVMSPARFVQRLRAERAQHLLAATKLSVEEIASRVGYTDSATLRRVIKRETGKSARELR